MDITKILLIENSGLTFQCDSVPSSIKESTDKTGMMILKGVPATILDKENGTVDGILGRKFLNLFVKLERQDCLKIVVSFVQLMIILKNLSLLQLNPHMLS